jgi:hypothetical protein
MAYVRRQPLPRIKSFSVIWEDLERRNPETEEAARMPGGLEVRCRTGVIVGQLATHKAQLATGNMSEAPEQGHNTHAPGEQWTRIWPCGLQ